MTLALRTRLSLGARMLVSLSALAVVSVAVIATAVATTGLVAWTGLYIVAALLDTWYAPLGAGRGVFRPIIRSHAVEIGAVSGLLLVPLLILREVRTEIRSFRRELGTTGSLAIDRHPEIATMAGRLAQQAGMAEPDVYIVNRSRPESYAIGGRSGGRILLTRGLIRTLPDEELAAVIAHEVGHLANRDSRLMGIALVPLLIAEHVDPEWLYHRIDDWGEDRSGNAGRAVDLFFNFKILLAVFPATVVWIAVLLITKSLQLGAQLGLAVLSRGREYAADRSAAQLTGSPGALASALQELDDERGRPSEDGRTWKRSASALDILPQEESRWSWELFRTHPSTDARIERLKALAAEHAESNS